MSKSSGYEDLTVWQKAHQFVINVYKITGNFPIEERFGLTNQIRRAAVSIPANIAEGSKRQYKKEFIQFLHVAKGSMAECEYYLRLVKDLDYLSQEEFLNLNAQSQEVGKMLTGLINSQKIR